MKRLIALLLILACGQAFAQSAAPTCYPPAATNWTIGLNPASYPAWIVAGNDTAYWALTWWCPSATDPAGYVGYEVYGYQYELIPTWLALSTSPKATLDALWNGNPNTNDAELKPFADAQLTATKPQPLKTTAITAYYVIAQADKYITLAVGTVPLGTACNASQSVDGMYGVPRAAVTWFGNVKPLAVVSVCQ